MWYTGDDGSTLRIYYATTPVPGVEDMILISISQTAEEEPNTAKIVILEEDIDAVTVNTDLKAYVSRDDGTTYSQITLADEGDFDGDKRILVGDVDISGQPSGQTMRYKLTTHNTKTLDIHGTALSWGD
jgi:hypothetical protein